MTLKFGLEYPGSFGQGDQSRTTDLGKPAGQGSGPPWVVRLTVSVVVMTGGAGWGWCVLGVRVGTGRHSKGEG